MRKLIILVIVLAIANVLIPSSRRGASPAATQAVRSTVRRFCRLKVKTCRQTSADLKSGRIKTGEQLDEVEHKSFVAAKGWLSAPIGDFRNAGLRAGDKPSARREIELSKAYAQAGR